KTVEADLGKLEAMLDAEFFAKVPTFPVEAFEGRKSSSDRRVVMELFTGVQCPPCVAADMAFEMLSKRYKPSELILLQYHLHIPGPDALTNVDSVPRAAYYGPFGAPDSFFDGEPAAGGGGPIANVKRKFDAYRAVVDAQLEKPSAAKLLLTAKQVNNKI